MTLSIQNLRDLKPGTLCKLTRSVSSSNQIVVYLNIKDLYPHGDFVRTIVDDQLFVVFLEEQTTYDRQRWIKILYKDIVGWTILERFSGVPNHTEFWKLTPVLSKGSDLL